MLNTRDGAPPWSGPLSAPTAADSAAATSAPVEATTRAVNVEALMPGSPARAARGDAERRPPGGAGQRTRPLRRGRGESVSADGASGEGTGIRHGLHRGG